jgi:hypothetical protein
MGTIGIVPPGGNVVDGIFPSAPDEDYPAKFRELRLLLSCAGSPTETAAELRAALESVARAERDAVDLPDYSSDPLATEIEHYFELAVWLDDQRRAGVEPESPKHWTEEDREIPGLVATLVPWIMDAPPEATAEPVMEPMPAEQHLTDEDRAALRKKITEARASDPTLATRLEAFTRGPASLPQGPERDAALHALLALAEYLDGMGFTSAELNFVIKMRCGEARGVDNMNAPPPKEQPAKAEAATGWTDIERLYALLDECKKSGKAHRLFEVPLLLKMVRTVCGTIFSASASRPTRTPRTGSTSTPFN